MFVAKVESLEISIWEIPIIFSIFHNRNMGLIKGIPILDNNKYFQGIDYEKYFDSFPNRK